MTDNPNTKINVDDSSLVRGQEAVNSFLEHRGSSKAEIAAYNREYYLRTRKLKGGRAPGRQPQKVVTKRGTGGGYISPKSKVKYNDGKPLKPLGSRMHEDETPSLSPSGARLVDYSGKGLGRATYADGMIYDAVGGWVTPKRAVANRQKAAVAKRVKDAQRKASEARQKANKLPASPKKTAVLKKLAAVEKKLAAAKPPAKTPTKRTPAKKPVRSRREQSNVMAERRYAQDVRRSTPKRAAPAKKATPAKKPVRSRREQSNVMAERRYSQDVRRSAPKRAASPPKRNRGVA